MNDVSEEKTSFARRLDELLKRTEYRIVKQPDELEQIYRLRYEANLREGTITASAAGKLHDRFDESPNGMNVGIYVDGDMLAALRLHVLSPEHPSSPALDAYPDLVRPLLEQGAHFIDTSRLAANFPAARAHPQLPYVTLRLGIMAATHFNAQIITGGCRAEHFPFYGREYFAVRACEPRPYPTLVKPLCLVLIDFRANRDAILARRPMYDSSIEERERLFKVAPAEPEAVA
ncbi:MAG: hypothetical protein K2Y29_06255 [Beijerinckiaceae bacterium]|nr:hypothetical protein [Beijerinckiaceae bacterium]